MSCPEIDVGTMGYNSSRKRSDEAKAPKDGPGLDSRGRPISTGYYYVKVDADGAQIWVRHEPSKEDDNA